MTEHTSLITPDRLDNLRRAVLRTCRLPGDMVEIGVYRGGSARVIAEACPDKLLHLFDTFEGLPYDEASEFDPSGLLKAGMFSATKEEVASNLAGLKIKFHVGEFPSTRHEIKHEYFSFIHVDCDLRHCAGAAIARLWPKLVPQGIMYFDDYGCKFTGVTHSVDSAFSTEMIKRQYDVNGFQIGAYVVKT